MKCDHLRRLFKAAKEAEPLLRVLENGMASSLSCDSRSHDANREPRRLLQQILNELKEPSDAISDSPTEISTWLERVDLAILANGGETWRGVMCSCDPSVGMSPCEYCAIHEALRYTKAQIAPRSNGIERQFDWVAELESALRSLTALEARARSERASGVKSAVCNARLALLQWLCEERRRAFNAPGGGAK